MTLEIKIILYSVFVNSIFILSRFYPEIMLGIELATCCFVPSVHRFHLSHNDKYSIIDGELLIDNLTISRMVQTKNKNNIKITKNYINLKIIAKQVSIILDGDVVRVHPISNIIFRCFNLWQKLVYLMHGEDFFKFWR